MLDPMIAVSLRASDEYRDRIRLLAMQKKEKVGDMVRKALDQVYGRELEKVAKNFPDSDTKK